MSRALRRGLLAGAALLAVGGGPVSAQTGSRHVGGHLVFTRLDTELVPLTGTPSTESFTGVALGLEGSVPLPLWELELFVRYLYGGLDSDDNDVSLDLVDAELQVGLRPIPWVLVKAGPHGRAFTTEAGTERWLFWEIRARAEAGLLAPRLATYLELWGALLGDVNFGRSFGSGRGAEAGLSYRPFDFPLWGRIAYRFDRGSVGGGARFDSVQEIVIGVAWDFR